MFYLYVHSKLVVPTFIAHTPVSQFHPSTCPQLLKAMMHGWPQIEQLSACQPMDHVS